MITPTFAEEISLWLKGYQFVAGLDEVGRGALAGPVVAAAVIFPCRDSLTQGVPLRDGKGTPYDSLRDSKLLSPAQRERLSPLIKKAALAWAVAEVSVTIINKKGIARASEMAMMKALRHLTITPDFHLVDYFHLRDIPSHCQKGITKGDTLVASIAAASIIAKVYRDHLMVKYHKQYPDYGFDHHKGYGTEFHRKMLERIGPSPLHRLAFL